MQVIKFLQPHMIKWSGSDGAHASLSEVDELYFDPCTMRYFTKSQALENQKLKEQLVEKEKEREKSINSLIGYFYKKR